MGRKRHSSRLQPTGNTLDYNVFGRWGSFNKVVRNSVNLTSVTFKIEFNAKDFCQF